MTPLDPSALASVEHCPGWIHTGLEWIQTGSDLLGISIISLALLVTALRWAGSEFDLLWRRSGRGRWVLLREIRLALGNYILLGLEFMIISDIIHSFLKPDLDSMTQLGIVVVIRTTIGYFLGKELEGVRGDRRLADPHPPLANVGEEDAAPLQRIAN